MGDDVLNGDLVGSLEVLIPLERRKQSFKGAKGDRDGRCAGADELPRGENEKRRGAAVVPAAMFQGGEPLGIIFGISKVFRDGRTRESVTDVGR
jgi:hypothetical protein